MKRLALIAAAMIATSVCASADSSDYQAAAGPGATGYFDAVGDDGSLMVGYTGAVGMSGDTVAQYALKHAGDVAAAQHKEWFAVLKTTSRRINVGSVDDLTARAGHFMGTGPQEGGTPSAGGNGGGNAPNAEMGSTAPTGLLEHWAPRKVYQTILVIQPGSGDQASFKGVDHPPQIFPATPPSGAH